MSVTTADTRAIAGKIVSAHNQHVCVKCRRPLHGGVLAFGLSGSDPRWYPGEDTARLEHRNGVRYYLPVRDHDVTVEEIVTWIDEQADDIEQLVEYVEQQREERRMARRIEENDHGFRDDPYPCADCGYPKRRPADRCDRCGDEPCPIGIDPHDYNRGYGYRD